MSLILLPTDALAVVLNLSSFTFYWAGLARAKALPTLPSAEAGKQKDCGSSPLWLSSLFSEKLWYLDTAMWLSFMINEALKWLSSLPILMQGIILVVHGVALGTVSLFFHLVL